MNGLVVSFALQFQTSGFIVLFSQADVYQNEDRRKRLRELA